VFGDTVVATALLDRLLHHAVVIQIEASSYRLRQHADLVPEHRGRPLAKRNQDLAQRLITACALETRNRRPAGAEAESRPIQP
jgi:hypothetical protein